MAVLTGCSKLNQENYDLLKMGMSKAEVESIIGDATECSNAVGTTSCFWGNLDEKHVKINFVAGKAVTFSHAGLE